MKNRNMLKATNTASPQNSIRIIPGIFIVVLQWISWLLIPNIVYGAYATMIMVFGSLIGGLAFFIWWIFYSRISKKERWIVFLLMVVALIIFHQFSHESMQSGMDGLMFYAFALPSLSMAVVIWAVFYNSYSNRIRLISLAITIFLSCGMWTLVRSNGLSGHAKADLTWRWEESSKERFFDNGENRKKTITSLFSENTKAEWPGFRGDKRDGKAYGTSIQTDWSKHPPVVIWRWPIGSGCSSFAVHNNLFYTQEQSGDFEVVSCYNLGSGEPIWKHRDAARFYDQHAGAGPRSTPTYNDGFIYTLGATGIINALNANNGSLIWSRNAAIDTDTKDSGWGFASSPLVVGKHVLVAATGKLIAYNKNTGDIVWMSSDGGDSYSSPHLMKINGAEQVVLTSGNGVKSFSPTDGEIYWEHSWQADTRILQPCLISNNELLINSGMKKGLRRLKVTQNAMDWEVQEIWSSSRMRTDFNDFVVHNKHIYGFDGPMIACINVENGEREWKGEKYGGQQILLSDQDLLLLLSEKGKLVLIKTDPNQFEEVSSFQILKGKTWNHPVLVGNILLVRNSAEVVALQL